MVSRNWPFGNLDDLSVYKEEQRPRKKACIDVRALVFPELYDPQPCLRKKPQLSARDESAFLSVIQVPRFQVSTFPKPGKDTGSRAVNQHFLSQIRQTPAVADKI